MSDKIYYHELACYENASKKLLWQIGKNGYYDLSMLPSEAMKSEFERYIRKRGEQVSLHTIYHEKPRFKQFCAFLDNNKNPPKSLLDWDEAQWIQQLKIWMLKEGLPLMCESSGAYGKKSITEANLICYLKNVLAFFQMEDPRPEQEKDIWHLAKLDMPIRENPIYNTVTLNFKEIKQKAIREEVKRAIYAHLKYEKLETIKRELIAMRKFSRYLQERYPSIQSCAEIDRALIEDYLAATATDGSSGRSHNNVISTLRKVLESIGKICEYPHLDKLFISMDVPPTLQPAFKIYSDSELKRLNAHIAQMDEQIARCLIIHQMLGTRISDTLTLKRDCLFRLDGQDMIQIQQVKTHTFQKPISAELAELIKKAVEYVEQKHGETDYIFVDEKNISRPLQYKTIQYKVRTMIIKQDLRDDSGELFSFNSHMFRRTYGAKLTELHIDDWTIAKLLGHKGTSTVRHYRRMNNQTIADETREIRAEMTKILLANLDGWEEEYEQIRQNGGK